MENRKDINTLNQRNKDIRAVEVQKEKQEDVKI